MLTKSQFIRGRNCPKRLYIQYHKLLEEPHSTLFEQSLSEQGIEVGILARELFPRGVDIRTASRDSDQSATTLTSEHIKNGSDVLYEASFEANALFAASDIIVRNGTKWDVYEVKSTGSVKENTIWDIAFQNEVLRAAGLKIGKLYAVIIDTDYKRGETLDVSKLFRLKDVTSKVRKLGKEVMSRIHEAQFIIAQKESPNTPIGSYCTQPHDCPFKSHCWKGLKEPSILNLKGGSNKRWELYYEGVETMKEVPADAKLSASQWTQVNAWKDGGEMLSEAEIRAFLKELQYPVWHLDFETYSAAVPVKKGHSPFQQIPFQYSIHRQDKPLAEPQHFEFLMDETAVSKRELIKKLLQDTAGSGSILAYNASFEKSIIRKLAKGFPEFQDELESRIDRIIDLMTPFAKKWYYKAEMNGSASIKKVVPAIAPEISYDELAISNGAVASHSYLHLLQGDFQGDKEQLRDELLEYCRLDTYSMVMILNKLYEITAD